MLALSAHFLIAQKIPIDDKMDDPCTALMDNEDEYLKCFSDYAWSYYLKNMPE